MNRREIEKIVTDLSGDIDSIADERTKATQKALLNIIEYILAENDKLRNENQKLRLFNRSILSQLFSKPLGAPDQTIGRFDKKYFKNYIYV